MALMLRKSRADILRQALARVERNTPINATSAGSVARAFVESITGEVADLYDVLDYTVAQSVLSTASGRSLDLIGQLYNLPRRTVGDLIQTDRKLGSFYFYIDTPYIDNIVITKGTRVFAAGTNFVAQQLYYVTVEDTMIPVGRLKAFVGISPQFDSGIYTAGAHTLVESNFVGPIGVAVKCTNPKPIAAQLGYEDDNNYRLRLIKNIRVTSAGTPEAIRFAALSVGGVRDVKVYDATFGLGSFEIVVVPETKDLDARVATDVQSAVNRVRPIGLSVYYRTPEYLPVDVTVNIFLPPRGGLDRTLAERRAEVAVLRYLNTLLPGDTLVYNKLIQYIFDSTDNIQDVQITRYAPNRIEAVRKNYTPKKEQMIIPGSITATSS